MRHINVQLMCINSWATQHWVTLKTWLQLAVWQFTVEQTSLVKNSFK